MRVALIAFIFLSFHAASQQVKVIGRVTDKRSKVLDNVVVRDANDTSRFVLTNTLGVYEFYANPGDTLNLIFELNDLKERYNLILENKTVQRIQDVKFNFILEREVVVDAKRTDPFEIPKLPKYDVQKIPMGSVERSLVYTTAAVSNNELTSNYNVRGGSYDENLVYVNGFNIYRPFLTRSGQQEGMSFINSALVSSIRFSAGGFDAQYGDRLSSVLDIEYKTPNSLRGSGMASLLGVESHLEHAPSNRLNFLVGARYRANGYLLNSLPAKGAYNPVFWDAQFLTNYAVTENITWSVIGHFSSNDYRFAPQTQKTDFGTANEAYSFMIYFDGQERSRFQTMMGGTSLKWKVNKKLDLDFYSTVFNTDEREYYDIQGQYYINELETDPSKEEYGDSIAVLGVGTFLNHARNRLNATIFNVYHNGKYLIKNKYIDDDRTKFRNQTFQWGANLQHDQFYDVLSEWKMIDSAGYSQPQASPNQVELYETIKGKLDLAALRYTGFIQLNSSWSNTKRNYVATVERKKGFIFRKTIETVSDTIRESNARWALSLGARTGYTTANNEFYITPRASVSYFPRIYMFNNGKLKRRDLKLRLASGLYYQPPFYREFRTFDGNLNLNVKSQKSFHAITGADVFFNMWDREVPFKFTAEAYFKYLWDVNPYEIDNVRTRYYA
ncbi:MAG: TonB-dependent receptor plug domain-containing protein, partial [Flavobacteriia bacterium]